MTRPVISVATPAARLAAALLLTLTAACASGPAPGPEAAAPPPEPPAPPVPSVWIDVSLRQPFGFRTAPAVVWFARVSGLNGSDCLPRPATFDPGLDRNAALGGATAGGDLARVGSVDGAGGAGAGGDPTCMYDEAWRPVWDPLLYTADRIEGTSAYLSNPPPARYVAAAATFRTDDAGSTVTVYFPETMLARTEVAVPPGESRYMGRFQVRSGGGGFDPAQAYFRDRIAPLGPGAAAQLLAAIITGLAGGEIQTTRHVPGQEVEAAAPPPAEARTYPW